MPSWSDVPGAPGIGYFTYKFGASTANALVLPATEGLIVISPPWKMNDADFDALDGREVVGLVAPNGYHHLGLPEWKKRFPKARLFASKPAAVRIHKKQPSLPRFESLDVLADLLPSHVSIFGGEAMRDPDVFARIDTDDGAVLFSNDMFCNFSKPPSAVIIRLAFKLVGTPVGLGMNGLAKFLIRDRKAFRSWLLDELATHPPTTIVPGHGRPVTGADLADRLQQIAKESL